MVNGNAKQREITQFYLGRKKSMVQAKQRELTTNFNALKCGIGHAKQREANYCPRVKTGPALWVKGFQ